MACVLFTLKAFNHDADGLNTQSMINLVTSNQSYAVYASEPRQTAQNHLAGVTFDWTNCSGIKSIMGFKPTNNFIN
jgi:hypothetical protein